MEKGWITTQDGVRIATLKNHPKKVVKQILCLHMMPATKESYIPFMQAAEPLNWFVFAIDFRGHGESATESLNYETFTDEDHQKYRIDASDALTHLSQNGSVAAIIGASIGANIALELQAQFGIHTTVLLSPGLNYRGIETIGPAQKLSPHQSCYIVASEEIRQSGESIADEAKTIFEALATQHKKIDIFPGQEHGTALVLNLPERTKKIIDFITETTSQAENNQ